ncbi:MAG: glycosyltransferase family 2 protein [Candidatus Aminicenantaceae bacterium]
MIKKAISIIIPAYNEEKYLLEALKSVAYQTFNHSQLEVIVVDNASTDNTAAVHQNFFKNHPTQHLLLKEPQLSPGKAKNTGAEKAQGEILLFLDADTKMSPQTVQEVDYWYKKGFLMGTIRITADSSDIVAKFFFDLLNFGKTIFNIACHMVFCQKQLFFQVEGFNPELKHAEDLDFCRKVKKALKRRGKSWCMIHNAPVATSTRRMIRHPLKLGYLITLLEWGFGGFLGFRRKQYIPYR